MASAICGEELEETFRRLDGEERWCRGNPINPTFSSIIEVTKYSGGAVLKPLPAMIERLRRTHDMGTIRIPLRSRKYPNMFAIIDEEDFDLVSQYRWHPHRDSGGHFYAFRAISSSSKSQQTQTMHRLILGITSSLIQGDHKNHNGLDNRRSNLRTCSVQENRMNKRMSRRNTTGFRGVGYRPERGCFRARISCRGKDVMLGHFVTAEEAARAYDRAARELYGEFANPNFPDDR